MVLNIVGQLQKLIYKLVFQLLGMIMVFMSSCFMCKSELFGSVFANWLVLNDLLWDKERVLK